MIRFILIISMQLWLQVGNTQTLLSDGTVPEALFHSMIKTITKEKRVVEKAYYFRLINGLAPGETSSASYHEIEKVLGSIEDKVEQKSFTTTKKISRHEAEEIMSKLIDAGFIDLSLKSMANKRTKEDDLERIIQASNLSEGTVVDFEQGPPQKRIDLVISKSERYVYLWHQSKTVSHKKVVAIIDDFIQKHELDKPEEPGRVTIVFDQPTVPNLVYISDGSLWNDYLSIGKTIKSIDTSTVSGNDRSRIKIKFKQDNEQIVLSGITQKSVFPISDYVGMTISDALVSSTDIVVTEGDHISPINTSIEILNRYPDKYHGKRVRIIGNYNPNLLPEDSVGYLFFADDKDNWLASGNISTFAKNGTRFISGWVSVDGTFVNSHLNVYNSSGTGGLSRITRIERLNR